MIIAECGVNFQGDISIAKMLIWQAKSCGADLVKFQLYDTPHDHEWHDLLKKCQLTKDQAFELFNYGREVGIEVFFSVFDMERLGWCEEMGVNRYKIASGMNRNRELIDAVTSTGKETMLSCLIEGTAYIPWTKFIKVLYCVPMYPTPLSELRFHRVNFSDKPRGLFHHKFAGFSDHTIGIEASMVALSRGASIIEKHFTLDKNLEGPDHICSMTPNELRILVEFSKVVSKVYEPHWTSWK